MKIKINDFNLRDTLMSGACFRATLESDGSFTNILSDRVINIRQINDELIVKSNKMNNLSNVIREYFDLNRDYNIINKKLIQVDPSLKDVIECCRGYHILNQNQFEMCISYIISQNNNVKRISASINKLCELYGQKVYFNGKVYFLFPTYEKLKELKADDLAELKIGFRDKYIIDFLNKYESFNDLDNLSTPDAFNKLLTVKGIGPKVASCILLFGYKRLDVFPIDTWVKQFVSSRYGVKDDFKTIENLAMNKYGKYSGLAIQYMYHYNRNINEEK